MKKHGEFLFLFIGLLTLALSACSGDDDDDGAAGGFAGTVGEEASVLITAAAGGTLSTPSGSVTLTVPAGALAADAELTVATVDTEGLPEADSLGSFVFEFGPSGTEFSAPVALSIALGGSVPEGKTAVLAVLEGDTWTDVAGSKVAGGAVEGEISHFSRYVVRYTDSGAEVVTEDDACQQLEFEACGGDPVGNWGVASYCLTDNLGGDEENPFAELDPACEASTMGADVTWDGTIAFNADGTWTESVVQNVKVFVEFQEACLVALGNNPENPNPTSDPEEVCTMLSQMEGMSACDYGDGLCRCDSAAGAGNASEPIEASGSYAVDGTNLAIGVGETGTPQALPFCVDGDTLVVEWFDSGDGINDYIILERK